MSNDGGEAVAAWADASAPDFWVAAGKGCGEWILAVGLPATLSFGFLRSGDLGSAVRGFMVGAEACLFDFLAVETAWDLVAGFSEVGGGVFGSAGVADFAAARLRAAFDLALVPIIFVLIRKEGRWAEAEEMN